jgi:hypothetical protein
MKTNAGIAVVPFLKQFCELAPLLFGRNGITEMSIYRDRLADDVRSRIRDIKPGELAKFRLSPEAGLPKCVLAERGAFRLVGGRRFGGNARIQGSFTNRPFPLLEDPPRGALA